MNSPDNYWISGESQSRDGECGDSPLDGDTQREQRGAAWVLEAGRS